MRAISILKKAIEETFPNLRVVENNEMSNSREIILKMPLDVVKLTDSEPMFKHELWLASVALVDHTVSIMVSKISDPHTFDIRDPGSLDSIYSILVAHYEDVKKMTPAQMHNIPVGDEPTENELQARMERKASQTTKVPLLSWDLNKRIT